jgi:uncharacterized protein (TIGR00645 family)
MRRIVEKFLFNARWLLIPFYLVLICALVVYAWFDVMEFIHYISGLLHHHVEAGVKESNVDAKTVAMLTFIELIDMAMIANLGKMIITGSYNSFVSKEHGYKGENISSGMLKVKMATSLVGVTSIGLLQRSVNVLLVSWDELYKLAFIHCLFLLGAIVLEIVDYFHCKSEAIEQKVEFKEHQFKHLLNQH